MEKRVEESGGRIIRVVLTGPECTGKSTLAKDLAAYYHTVYVPEYAREYIANLGRPYVYKDVLHIAEIQLKQANELTSRQNGIVFLDTYLIITKIWLELVFGNCPGWIEQELARQTIDLYLLCNTNIPWEADPVRENGGEMREKLYLRYRLELDKFGCTYRVISGTGQQRLENAIEAVNGLLPDNFL